ncbi:hypothetical protein C8A05DRAFT_14516, partial [Staphylotrichum tortipilum]
GKQRPECAVQFGRQAFVKTVESQVKTMGRQSRGCRVEAQTCMKLACSLDGGISWCNDGVEAITRPCALIARDAMRVVTRCKHGIKRHSRNWAQGEIRDSDRSRVVVNQSGC